MRALDTNVLLRFITQDHQEESAAATRFIEEELTFQDPGFVPLPVLCETVWTLRRVYRLSKESVSGVVEQLLSSADLRVEAHPAVRAALGSRGDLIDALIHELGRRAGCSETVTLDKAFASLPGVRLLEA